MKRFHLFEFEDLPWFPSRIRNYMTDYLQFVSNQFDFYKPVVPVLECGLVASGGETIVDLASGGGGGLRKLAAHLAEAHPKLCIILTDRYPNAAAFARTNEMHPEVFRAEKQPVDAREVPDSLKGLRTQFLSLHHFEPDDVQRILRNAVEAGQPIAVFEAQKRDLSHLIRFAFSPLFVVLMTPLIRPFRWGRLLFTYVVPAVPLFVFWDGLVSVLRTYSTAEMLAMARAADPDGQFEWRAEVNTDGAACIQYLLGVPRSQGAGVE